MSTTALQDANRAAAVRFYSPPAVRGWSGFGETRSYAQVRPVGRRRWMGRCRARSHASLVRNSTGGCGVVMQCANVSFGRGRGGGGSGGRKRPESTGVPLGESDCFSTEIWRGRYQRHWLTQHYSHDHHDAAWQLRTNKRLSGEYVCECECEGG